MLFFTRRFALVSLTAASLFLGACNRDSLPTMEQQLVGRWEWQQSTTDNTPTITPANSGHEMVVEFDRRGRARFYQDGHLTSVAAFSVRHKRGGFRGPGRHIILYRGYEGSQYYSVSGNMLYLEEMRGQATRHCYVRLPSENALSSVTPAPL